MWRAIGLAGILLTLSGAPAYAQQLQIPATPVLSFPESGPYAGDGINPNTGDTTTVFTFRIRYSNSQNTIPDYVEVCFTGPQTFCKRQSNYVYDATGYVAPRETLENIQVTFTKPGEYRYYFHTFSSWHVYYPGLNFDQKLPLIVGSATAPPTALFIPGLQGSRLYHADGGEEKLWEPSSDNDVKKLFLDENGTSVLPGVYTRDIIDEAFGHNIYKSFATFMNSLVADHTLTAWQPVPYDWRLDVSAHVPAVIQKLTVMKASSPNSKITLIAHSNGGLIAKSVLQELARQKAAGTSTLIDSIDRLILVATPQLGTPKTIASILHGYDLDYAKGALLNEAVARALAQYMPSAFNLLPSTEYFSRITDSPVEFDPSVDQLVPWRTMYGDTVDSPTELRSFLTGGNGAWSGPNLSDVVSPIVVQDHFLDTASANQSAWQSWTPPPSIKVIEIAGWGLDTVKTVRYTTDKVWSCGDLSPTFCRDHYVLDYEPVFTVEGDKTVVNPSALAFGSNKYYVNLVAHNKELFRLRRNRSHADILEVEPLQQFIKNIIKNVVTLPPNISNLEPPVDDDEKRIRLSVHSPVSLLVCSETLGDDGQPLCTGVEQIPGSDLRRKVEDIPNSYYMEFGEGKYVGVDADEPHTIKLEGEGTGTFTLDIKDVVGDSVVNQINYEDIPVIADTEAELTLQDTTNAEPLMLDMVGDGTPDITLGPGVELSSQQLLTALDTLAGSFTFSVEDKASIHDHILNIQKFLANEKQPKRNQLIDLQLKNIVKKVNGAANISITSEEAATLLQIIDKIKTSLSI